MHSSQGWPLVSDSSLTHKQRDAMKYLIWIGLLVSVFAQAEIYKWVDENGRVHFGDSPRAEDGAEKVRVDVVSYDFVEVAPIDFYQSDKKRTPARQVVMYSTSWCGYCRKAREHFVANKVKFVEYDIEQDKAAHQRFKALGGKGVPLIVVGKQRMSGFSAQRFDQLYQ